MEKNKHYRTRQTFARNNAPVSDGVFVVVVVVVFAASEYENKRLTTMPDSGGLWWNESAKKTEHAAVFENGPPTAFNERGRPASDRRQ